MASPLEEAIGLGPWVHDRLPIDELSEPPEPQHLPWFGRDTVRPAAVLHDARNLGSVADTEHHLAPVPVDDFGLGRVLGLATATREAWVCSNRFQLSSLGLNHCRVYLALLQSQVLLMGPFQLGNVEHYSPDKYTR